MNLMTALNLFMHSREVYCSPATLYKYGTDLGLFFKYLSQRTGLDADTLTFDTGFNLYAEYIVYLRSTGVKNATIRSYCRSVKAYLKWCYEHDYCQDYLKGVKLPKDDAAPKLPLCQTEVEHMDMCFDMNTLLGRRNYCIIHLMLDCGLRSQEVLHLKMEHIFADRNIIHILDSKGNKSRMTLIPDFLLDALAAYCSMAGISSGCLLRNKTGEPLTGNCIKLLFQDLKKQADLPRVHAHLLRHTFATSYLIGGGNLEFLRVFLGHTDYAVTRGYSQLAAEMKMLGADIYRLDTIFFTRGY